MNLGWLHAFLTRAVLIHWGIPLGLFLLALAARLPALGRFLTPDEFVWVDRSRNFLAGLLNSDHVCWSNASHTDFRQAVGLACTLRTGHPGVTTMWTGSLGIVLRYLADRLPGSLFDYVLSIQTDPLDPRFIIPVRLPTVALTSLWVVVVYWLVLRLFADRRIGLAAGLLLALDPFHIALSRVIHHDALSTAFMTLSLLTALVYWGQGGTERWLVASGGLAGLAFLSKSPALFLIPFVALVGAWSLIDRWARGESLTWQRVATTVIEWMLWFDCAAAVFIAFWPAMWVIPANALRTIFFIGRKYASEGIHNYLLGTVSHDPGLLFYPVTWLRRSSPLVWVGLGVAAISRLCRSKSTLRRLIGCQTSKPVTRYLPLLLLYTILFIAFMTLGAKKDERYILPVYPILNVVAAVGLVQLLNFKSPFSILRSPFSIAIILLFQGALIIANYPYYLTYYNPLLGGSRTAERLVTLGWGEGLDLAAAYLNQKSNADHLKAVVWYHSTFAPYFHGQSVGHPAYFFSVGEVMSHDYLVVYRSQLQCQVIDPDILAYFQRHCTPEYVVHLKGIDYALVYAVPVEHRTAWQLADDATGKLILYGYRQASTQPGALTLRLVWENQGMSAEDGLWAALQFSPEGEPLVWQPCALAPGFSPAEAQKTGALVESVCELNTEDLEPGIYSLRIGVRPSADGQAESLLNPRGGEGVVDLLTPWGEWNVSVPSVGAPSLIAPDKD